MDRDTAITRIQNGLGFRTTLSSTIALRMQEEQRDLERGKTLPRFLMLEDQSLSLVIATQSVNLPSNFLRRSPNLIRYTPSGTTTPVTIPWREKDAAYEAYSDSDTDGPQIAVLRKSTILFFPVADANYTLTWDYFKKDTVLDSNVENLWLENAPELIIGGAGLRIAKDLRDASAIKLFGDMYQQARMTWFGENVVDEAEDGPLVLGADA